MLHTVYIPLSTTFGVIILALCLAFCRHLWKMARAYGQFPSKRLDTEWLLPIILGRHPKEVPFTSVIFQKLLKTACEFRRQGLCVIWHLKPQVIVFNEELMKHLVNEVNLANKSSTYDINHLVFGNGLLGSKHEVWKVHRKLLNPAFNMGVLKSKMPSLNKYAHQLVKKLENLLNKPVDDAWEILKYCAFQNMADFVLGLELNNERHVSLARNFVKIVDSMAIQFVERKCRPWLYWNFLLPLFPSGRKYLKTVGDANRQVREIWDELMKKIVVSEKEQRNDDDSGVFSSCGDILMKLYLQDPNFTEQDVRDHLVNFVTAGYDTVSVSMLWCFYALGHHPAVQEKAFHEVQSIVPEGDITYEDLTKMKYLDCVIKETLRLYPTVPMVGRKASKEIKCGKYTIPKGAEVTFFIFMLHRDPNIFPEPEKFDPERFSNSSKLRPWMFIPFAEGYRNCIGKRFAMMEIKVQLAHVLRRFRITSVSKMEESDFDWTIILKPIKPVRFLLEKVMKIKC